MDFVAIVEQSAAAVVAVGIAGFALLGLLTYVNSR